MKRIMFFVSVIAIAGIVFASEPFINPSSLISAPQAYMPNQGTMQIAYNSAAFFTEKSKWTTKYDENQSNFSIFYSPYQNLQLGLSSVIDLNQNSTYGLELKYQLYDERGSMPAVAIGASQFGNTTQQTVYIVASKQFGKDTRVSLGIGNGGYLGSGSLSGWFNGAVFGIQQYVFGVPVIMEFAGDSFNLGTSIRFNDKMSFNMAVCELENLRAGGMEPRFVFGFTIEEPFEDRVVLNDVYSESHGYASKEISSEKYTAVFKDVKKTVSVAPAKVVETAPPVAQTQANAQTQATMEQLKKIEDSLADLKKQNIANQAQINEKIARLEQEKIEISKLATDSDLKNKVVIMDNEIKEMKESIVQNKNNDNTNDLNAKIVVLNNEIKTLKKSVVQNKKADNTIELNKKIMVLNNEISDLKNSIQLVNEKSERSEEVAVLNDKVSELNKQVEEVKTTLIVQEEKRESFYKKVLRKIGLSK